MWQFARADASSNLIQNVMAKLKERLNPVVHLCSVVDVFCISFLSRNNVAIYAYRFLDLCIVMLESVTNESNVTCISAAVCDISVAKILSLFQTIQLKLMIK